MRVSRVKTKDGSYTLINQELNEQYHSMHGAIQEAQHVYVKHGFEATTQTALRILEIGFGTGLNFLVTAAAQGNRSIYYEAVESCGLDFTICRDLGYCRALNREDLQSIYSAAHTSPWNSEVTLSPKIKLIKKGESIETVALAAQFDLVYFDAFAPKVQPHVWTKEIFSKIYNSMSTNGLFVTYSAKGEVRRDLMDVGFQVEKLPGAPGKREMLRAKKI